MFDKCTLNQLSGKLVSYPEDPMRSFRRNVFMYLERREITLAELAEAADISLSTLKTFLYGSPVDCYLSLAVKLARVFQVSIDELVGAGTVNPKTLETFQIIRTLPDSFTQFVRWATRYHAEQLRSGRISAHAVEVMIPDFENGNVRATNHFDVKDITDLGAGLYPKIYMGIQVPCNYYAPYYYEGQVAYMAYDREPRSNEDVVISISGNLFLARRRVELIDNRKVVNYYGVRIDRRMAGEDECMFLGYVAAVR